MIRWNAKLLSECSISLATETIQIIWLKGKPIQKLIKYSPWWLKYWTNCFPPYDKMLTVWQRNDASGSLYSTSVSRVIDSLWVQRSKVVGGVCNEKLHHINAPVISISYLPLSQYQSLKPCSELMLRLHSIVHENLCVLSGKLNANNLRIWHIHKNQFINTESYLLPF